MENTENAAQFAEASNAPVTPADEAPAAQPEEPTTGTATETPNEQPKDEAEKPVQKRISELTRMRREAERERDFLAGRLAELERRSAPPSGEQPALPTVPTEAIEKLVGPRPDPSKFPAQEFDPAYYAAVSRWESRAALAEAGLQQRQMQQVEMARRAEAERQARADQIMSKGAATYPDFADVVINDPTLPITPVMVEALTQSDMGADVAYWLGKNREEAARIARLSPVAAAREITRIEARLEREREASRVSSAPPPVTTVTGSNNKPNRRYDVTAMPDDEAAAYMDKLRRLRP